MIYPELNFTRQVQRLPYEENPQFSLSMISCYYFNIPDDADVENLSYLGGENKRSVQKAGCTVNSILSLCITTHRLLYGSQYTIGKHCLPALFFID